MNAFKYFTRIDCPHPEEVRHSDVTARVKRAWIVITADKYSFFSFLEAFYFQFFLTSAQALVLWML